MSSNSEILWLGHFRRSGLPCNSKGKESACDTGDQDLIPGSGRSSGEGSGNLLQYSCLENSVRNSGEFCQENLAGCSLWGREESDTAEWLTHTHRRSELDILEWQRVVLQRPMKVTMYGIWKRQWQPHSSTVAWKIPWTEKPGRLQSMGSQIVGHDQATSLSLSWNLNVIG